MAWNGSGGYIGGLRYGAGSMGAHGWHGTSDSLYQAHNSRARWTTTNGQSLRRNSPAITGNEAFPATSTNGNNDSARAGRVDRWLDQATDKVDFGGGRAGNRNGGNGITKKELVAALKNANITPENVVNSKLARVILAHKDDFATSKTADLAERAVNGDKDAIDKLL